MLENKKDIGLFAQNVVLLISLGKTESLQKITEEMTNRSVVRYICNRYKENISFLCDDRENVIDTLEEQYEQYNYVDQSTANRKWGIVNENDGLLLLVSLALEMLR